MLNQPLYTRDGMGIERETADITPYIRNDFLKSGHNCTWYSWERFMETHFLLSEQEIIWKALKSLLPKPIKHTTPASGRSYIIFTTADILHMLRTTWFGHEHPRRDGSTAARPEKYNSIYQKIQNITALLPGQWGTAFEMGTWYDTMDWEETFQKSA